MIFSPQISKKQTFTSRKVVLNSYLIHFSRPPPQLKSYTYLVEGRSKALSKSLRKTRSKVRSNALSKSRCNTQNKTRKKAVCSLKHTAFFYIQFSLNLLNLYFHHLIFQVAYIIAHRAAYIPQE